MGSQRLRKPKDLQQQLHQIFLSSLQAAGANFMIMQRRCCAAPCLAQSPRNNWSLPQAWFFWNFTEVLCFFLNCLFDMWFRCIKNWFPKIFLIAFIFSQLVGVTASRLRLRIMSRETLTQSWRVEADAFGIG